MRVTVAGLRVTVAGLRVTGGIADRPHGARIVSDRDDTAVWTGLPRARGPRPGTNIAITHAPNDPAAHSQNAITNPRSAGSPSGPEMCWATIVAQI